MVKKKRKEHKRLSWEYCECGCKGYDVWLGALYYWLFWDLHEKKKLFYLHTGHGGHGEHLGKYSSFDAADRAVRKHAKPLLKKLRTELEKAEKALS